MKRNLILLYTIVFLQGMVFYGPVAVLYRQAAGITVFQMTLIEGISLVLITLGSEGVFYRLGDATGVVPGVPTKVADTNGAGDTFFGAVLSRLSRRAQGALEGLTKEELEEILTFANRAASVTCSRSGAIPAMPTLEEL